jgi:flagellar motor switch protein FliM
MSGTQEPGEQADDGWGAALGGADQPAAAGAADDGWGAALGGETADDEPAEPARVLSQAEIDSLLGFSGDSEDGEARVSGMERVISRGLVSYERLPMLEIVFDRLVRILSTSLRNFTSDNVEVSIDGISSLRFGDYLNSIPLPRCWRSSRRRSGTTTASSSWTAP